MTTKHGNNSSKEGREGWMEGGREAGRCEKPKRESSEADSS